MKTPRVILATLVMAGVLQAIEWPKDYEPVKGATSPDGRYGILAVKPADGNPDKDYDANSFFEELGVNYLADLKKHQVVASITGVSYPDMAHGGLLTTQWAADDSWCVACYDGKWGFRTVILLQLANGGMKQTDLGEAIQNECDKVTKAFLSFSCKPADGGVLEVSAAGLDNPKELPDVSSHYVVFSGTYDLAATQWRVLHAHAASKAEYEKASGSEAPRNNAEEARRTKLDAELNRVYHDLKVRLPAESFAKVQLEQRDWLAGAGMEATAAAENDRTQARIRALQKSLPATAGPETPELRRERLDAELNQVYRDLKGRMPAERFAKVQAEQRDWLAEAGKAVTQAAENERTQARVEALRKLLRVDPGDETTEARRDRLDSELNAVYRELKARCPADQFAKIAVQQRDWLTGAGKAATLTAENLRTEARVLELQELLKTVKR